MPVNRNRLSFKNQLTCIENDDLVWKKKLIGSKVLKIRFFDTYFFKDRISVFYMTTDPMSKPTCRLSLKRNKNSKLSHSKPLPRQNLKTMTIRSHELLSPIIIRNNGYWRLHALASGKIDALATYVFAYICSQELRNPAGKRETNNNNRKFMQTRSLMVFCNPFSFFGVSRGCETAVIIYISLGPYFFSISERR